MRAISALLPVVVATGCLDDLSAIPEVFDEEAAPPPCEGKCDGANDLAALGALPTSTLATLFAPHEPALGVDLLLIRDVVAARKTDPATYAEGANPFRIQFAVYNLDSPYITQALADAEAMGVDVQILIEHDQLDPAKDYNVQDDYLVAHGFELVTDHKTLDATRAKTADLIGITGGGLMHLKTRLYSWRDASGAAQTRLVTGSMNPGNLAVHNDETLHYIAVHDVIARYQAKYDAVRAGKRITNAVTGGPVEVFFSPDGGPQVVDRIAQLIDNEQEAILFAVFSLRNIAPTTGGKGILDRLVDAHRRGVPVVVITDRKQSDGVDVDGNPIYANDKSEEILRSAGIPVYEVVNRYSPYNAMHTKYAVFGTTNPIVVTDAGNWSRASLGSGTSRPTNDESVLVLDTARLDGGVTGRRYLGHFIELLSKYGADASPLLALPSWPSIDVTFGARAETQWGENVFVTGDHAVLGDWTRAGAGVPLYTDGATYPQWASRPTALPLGTRLEYKLVKRNGGAVTWEGGGNRSLIVDPTDRRTVGGYPQPAVRTEAAWR